MNWLSFWINCNEHCHEEQSGLQEMHVIHLSGWYVKERTQCMFPLYYKPRVCFQIHWFHSSAQTEHSISQTQETKSFCHKKPSRVSEITLSPLWLHALVTLSAQNGQLLPVKNSFSSYYKNLFRTPTSSLGLSKGVDAQKTSVLSRKLPECFFALALIFPVTLQTFDFWNYQSELPSRNSEHSLPNHNSL